MEQQEQCLIEVVVAVSLCLSCADRKMILDDGVVVNSSYRRSPTFGEMRAPIEMIHEYVQAGFVRQGSHFFDSRILVDGTPSARFVLLLFTNSSRRDSYGKVRNFFIHE